jgi:hypothetical protein
MTHGAEAEGYGVPLWQLCGISNGMSVLVYHEQQVIFDYEETDRQM